MSKKITFFAGAGFSRAVSEKVESVEYRDRKGHRLKMPLVNEMFDNISSRDYLSEFLKLGEYRFLGNYLLKRTGNRFPEISYEEVYHEIQRDSYLTNSEKEYLTRLIEEMVFENLGNNFPPLRYKNETKQTIKIIRKVIEKHKVKDIITTNPDILLETAIAGCTEYDTINFGSNITILNTDFKPVLKKSKEVLKIGIVKLHGSVLFMKCNNFNKVYMFDIYDWTSGESIQKFKNKATEKLGGDKNDYSFCVIPPSTDKRDQYKEEPWNTWFKNAKKILKESQKIIFFGFGFSGNDKALRDLFKNCGYYGKVIEIYDIKAKDPEFKKAVKGFIRSQNLKFNDDIDSFFKE